MKEFYSSDCIQNYNYPLRECEAPVDTEFRQFTAALESAPIGFVVFNFSGKVAFANSALAALAGLTIDQIAALPFGGQLAPESDPGHGLGLGQIYRNEAEKFETDVCKVMPGSLTEYWVRLQVCRSKYKLRGEPILVAAVASLSQDLSQIREIDSNHHKNLVSLTASLPGALCIYRSHPAFGSRAEFVTPAYTELFGIAHADDSNWTSGVFQNVHPDDVPQLLRQLKRAAEENANFSARYRVLHPLRGTIIVEETSAQRQDAQGWRYWYSFLQDVTERAKLDQAFSEQSILYTSILSNATEAIIAADNTGRVTVFNAAAEAMFGYQSCAVTGTQILNLFTIESQEYILSLFRGCGTAVGTYDIPKTVVRLTAKRRDGSTFPADVSLSATGSASTAIISAVIRDQSEFTRAETQLRKAAAVFENSQEAIAITNINGEIIQTNPSFDRLLTELSVAGRKPPASILKILRGPKAQYRQVLQKIADSGSWQGEAWINSKNRERVPHWVVVSTVKDVEGRPCNYVVSCADISRIKNTEMQLQRQALHDALTGLPNRSMLQERLKVATQLSTQTGSSGAVLFIDLDRFKRVNDSLGHKAGDELLLQVAWRLQDRVRGCDTVARLGGDEFVVVLKEVTTPDCALIVASSIIELLERPFTITPNHEVYISASIGVSVFPLDGTEPERLMQNADAALYAVKETGRGMCLRFTPELTSNASDKLATEARMRRALERNEFELHYQPLVDLKKNKVIGVEALLRWNDPKLGLIPPLSFIPLAEETGFICLLGDWAIQKACSQFSEWRSNGLVLDRLAINLSARQFKSQNLPELIASAIKKYGIPAACIELEITESTLMEDSKDALQRLQALKKTGIKLAIDDFGTGYSSLAYLKRFPIDTLKIDRGFVTDIGKEDTANRIVEAVISLGKSLKISVLAEGIETAQQAAFLRTFGCQFGQGYLFAKPVPAELVAEQVDNLPLLIKKQKKVRGYVPPRCDRRMIRANGPSRVRSKLQH